ncbi:MAG: type IV pilus modification PilV family protein [Fusobacteriota bacterium]
MNKGYSLIEVLMAFAILAISVLPIMSMYPVIFGINQGSVELEEASRLTLTVIDYIKAKGYDNLMETGANSIDFTITDSDGSKTKKIYDLVSDSGGYTDSDFEDDFNYSDGLFVLNSKGLPLSNTKIAVLLRKAKVQLDTDPDDTVENYEYIYDDFIIGKVVIGWGEDDDSKLPTKKEDQFSTQFIVTPIDGD